MVKEQLTDENNNAEEMKLQLTRLLKKMHKLKIPDAEILELIQNIMDTIQNKSSSFREYKDALFSECCSVISLHC